ncbi:phage DNA ejection protein [Salmonella enterica subsp. enterica serovar Corvallis]|uniref:Acyltransferase n=3 Tax=Salmonella enterica TaxID=28901 RepID=A0A3V4A685_SALNE|nr:phage DNA ejection protein [Salmonella enterica]EAA6458381.1 acyltransferase [Salmonella enterica subsp. enterica serovar Corvallis]EAW1093783.1 acyltransferase [Salmonella enterica subsp. enterica serovar Albany]EBB7691695.1 acyltransferase [Salmonella enterica subsp. enterica serovar Muenchen]EBR0371343.1 acyltransferase [Salmonella enterica subsp. enterica serovar Kottbus]EBS5642631.1 acyltransferase [Salmonella enterica subsp. enterica serovar Hadar]ECB5701744.1 acyltransferase [Salmon
MATWQGTNGGLLAGIGGVNSNAPSVNDIGNTLQLIRQNNDIERSGANNVGLTALQGLSGIAGVFQQEKQAQRQKEFQQAYANAYASGDRGALRQLATQYPDQIESVRKGMGFIDEDQRNSIGTLAAGARLASSSPEAMQSWLQNNAKELTRVGVDPNNVVQMYQQNPSGFGEFVDHLGMAALGPIDYFNVQDKMAGREIDRGRLAETIRSNQAGEALQQRGQDITVRGQNISAQNAALSREIQRAELQDKVLDRQIARETNQIKLDELKQKQADVRHKAEIAKADRQAAAQGAVDTFSTALDSLNEIEQSPGLSKAVGIRSAFPTVPGSDAANFEARLDTFKAQTFLPMVQSLKGMGALSDAEGKKLSDAVGALSPKMSEKAFRDSIGKIRNQLESKLSTVKKQFDYQEPVQNAPVQQSPAGSNFSSLWGD